MIVRKERSNYYSNHCHRERKALRMTILQIDEYILDALMRQLVGHDRQPSAFLVYLLLWRLSHGKSRARVQIALTDIAEIIGLSKRSVQDGISWLSKQKLISIERENITSIPWYTVLRPWRRGEK
jgi:hypothetical protein